MELKDINKSMVEKKDRKPPKPSYRSLFGVKEPNKKSKGKAKNNPRSSSKPKRLY